MTTVLTGMVVVLGIAVAVLLLVAIPRVREGEKILTPDGESAVRDARRRAQAMATQTRGRAGAARDRAVEAARERRTRAEAGQRQPAGAASAAAAVPPAPAASVGAVPPETVRLDEPGEERERVVDLRERQRPDVVARQRIARALEWGEPEPGPRHRR